MSYNLSQIRILWEIASDGLQFANITSSSEQIIGDFSVSNIKSDIIEQVWRAKSATQVGSTYSPNSVWFVIDCGLKAGSSVTKEVVFDTLAILNHNLTKSAKISVWGYGTSNTGSATRDIIKSSVALGTGKKIIDGVSPDADYYDFLWVMPEEDYAGAKAYRHYLVEITDTNNVDAMPDGTRFIQIGRFVAGAATIFTKEENLTSEITYQEVSYKDEVKINGFTSISNSRSIKKKIRASFKSLNAISNNGNTNYYNLKRYLRYCRDTLKALVIIDSRDPYLFYAYGKVSEMPQEQCNYVDDGALYVSLDVEWDEAK